LSCRCRRAGCTAGDDANEVRARESAVNIAPAGEWPAYGADKAGTKYSPLVQINRYTIGNVEIAWRKSAMPERVGRTVQLPAQANHDRRTPYIRNLFPDIAILCRIGFLRISKLRFGKRNREPE
jgi:hypothetical protein